MLEVALDLRGCHKYRVLEIVLKDTVPKIKKINTQVRIPLFIFYL